MKEPNTLIKFALDATVKLVNKKTDPTIALQKVANEFDLSPDYIQRVGEALNVALHHHHFKVAADKSIDFPVADIPFVKKAMFGTEEKTDLKKKADYFFNNFEEAPVDYNKILNNQTYQKNYLAVKTSSENYTSFPTSLKGMMKQSSEKLQRLEKELDVLRTKRAGLNPTLEGTFSKTVRELQKDAAARTPFEEVESQVFAKLGEASLPYLDLVYKTAGLKEPRGVHDSKYQFFKEAKATELLSSILKIAQEVEQVEQQIKEAELYYKSQYDLYKTACANLVSNDQVKTAEYSLTTDFDPVRTFMKAKLEKKAVGPSPSGGLISILMDKAKGLVGNEPATPVFQNTPSNNNERKHILQELIMTDPLLAKEDPQKIVGAYEQFVRIAPHASLQKEVVRAHIRSSLAGQAISPFDAAQITDSNLKLMNQHKMLANETIGKPSDDKNK